MDYLLQGLVQAFRLIFSMNEETWSAVVVTLQLTGLSMLVTLVLGLPLGFCLGYFDFRGKKILRLLVDTCL